MKKRKKLVEDTRQAFLEFNQRQPLLIGDQPVLSDSEIDMEGSDKVKEIKSLMSEEGKKRIRATRIALKHKTKRDVAKTVAANNILRQKIGKRISRVIKEHPRIGKDIEDFVKSKPIGADAWRRM